MPLADIVIARATLADVAGILQLERANQTKSGGTLSSSLEAGEVAATIRQIPNIVARQEGRVVGFLLAWEKTAPAPPTVQAMLQAYSGEADAYVYGPICVDARVRGRGVAGAMFAHLLSLIPEREGILFIKSTNASSLRAHAKMTMRQVGEFTWNESVFLVLAYKPAECAAVARTTEALC